MKIAVCGLGTWGFALARHLALLGHKITGWDYNTDLCQKLKKGEDHPHLFHSLRGLPITVTETLEENIQSAELIVESVTMKGMRSLFTNLKPVLKPDVPVVLTSKGIEQKTHKLGPQIALEVMGEAFLQQLGVLSGPSFAEEVANKKPTAVSLGVQNKELHKPILDAFLSSYFRVYPNKDILGVAFGGAMKNVIAVACGVAHGLDLGTGASAALVTRGLHEMVKLAVPFGCHTNTLYGLSGLGDLYLTCSSPLSRNFRFGNLLSEGLGKEEAEKKIGMVVEGANTCFAALEAAKEHKVQMPITECVVKLINKEIAPDMVVETLMKRHIKEEHL